MLRKFVFLFMSTVTVTNWPGDDGSREEVVKTVTQIQRADYEGDRSALRKLYVDLEPFENRDDFASRVRYWRGFARWRRAINGFNESPTPPDLEQDLQDAVAEFSASAMRDPVFTDAKIAELSCLTNLLYLHRADQAQVRAYAAKASPLLQEAKAAAPDNPRLYWVLSPIYWNRPVESGGGQSKAFEALERGLEAARRQRVSAGNPLDPSWGEPELLMALAWSYQHRAEPDLEAAEKYAESALTLVPDWHYVRDILRPQIRSAIEVNGIQKLPERDIAASKSGDFETLKSLFTEDAVVMPPGSDFVRGRAAREINMDKMRQTMSQFQVLDYREDFEELKIYGDEAVEWGTITGKMRDTKSGIVETSAYKVMRVLRKQPSLEWRIARSIYNDMPTKGQNRLDKQSSPLPCWQE